MEYLVAWSSALYVQNGTGLRFEKKKYEKILIKQAKQIML